MLGVIPAPPFAHYFGSALHCPRATHGAETKTQRSTSLEKKLHESFAGRVLMLEAEMGWETASVKINPFAKNCARRNVKLLRQRKDKCRRPKVKEAARLEVTTKQSPGTTAWRGDFEIAFEVTFYLIQGVFSSRLVRYHTSVAITAITKYHQRATVSSLVHSSRRSQRHIQLFHILMTDDWMYWSQTAHPFTIDNVFKNHFSIKHNSAIISTCKATQTDWRTYS